MGQVESKEFSFELLDDEVVVSRLSEMREKEGLKAIFWDLDDTITQTKFRKAQVLFLNGLAEIAEVELGDEEVGQLANEWTAGFFELRRYYGVNRKNHRILSEIAAKRLGIDVGMREYKKLYGQVYDYIYETVPEEVDGSRRALRVAGKAGFESILLTHGDVHWTEDIKLVNFRGAFRSKYMVDVNGQKDEWEWYSAIRRSGYVPSEVVAVGDSWTTDMIPAVNIRVRHAIRVRNGWTDSGPSWPEITEVINTGFVPEGLISRMR